MMAAFSSARSAYIPFSFALSASSSRSRSTSAKPLWPQGTCPCPLHVRLMTVPGDVRIPSQVDDSLALRKRGGATWHNASDVKLRNAHLAVIDRSKVLDYLLNEAHPDNGGKARFFALLGYSREDPERLMKALRDVAEHGEVVSSAESVHGEKYVVDGWCRCTLKKAGSGRSGRFGLSTAGKIRRGSSPRILARSDHSR
jgi:hypothetical protein